MVVLFWRRQKSRFSVLNRITQHVAGKDFAVFLPEHVLQHLPGQENAIILTGHVLSPFPGGNGRDFLGAPLAPGKSLSVAAPLRIEGLRCLVTKHTMAGAPRIARRLPCNHKHCRTYSASCPT